MCKEDSVLNMFNIEDEVEANEDFEGVDLGDGSQVLIKKGTKGVVKEIEAHGWLIIRFEGVAHRVKCDYKMIKKI